MSKVIANLGVLKDGRTVLVTEKANGIEFVVASGYDPTQPEGSQWEHGTYLNTVRDLANVITYTDMPIGYGRLVEIASKAIDGLRDNDEDEALEYCQDEIDMDEDELEFFGFELKENEEDEE